jgi:hypothetical protein
MFINHVSSGADRGTDRLGTPRISNSWGSGGCRFGAHPIPVGCRRYLTPVRRAPRPGGLQALPDAGSARTQPRWAAGEIYGTRTSPLGFERRQDRTVSSGSCMGYKKFFDTNQDNFLFPKNPLDMNENSFNADQDNFLTISLDMD